MLPIRITLAGCSTRFGDVALTLAALMTLAVVVGTWLIGGRALIGMVPIGCPSGPTTTTSSSVLSADSGCCSVMRQP